MVFTYKPPPFLTVFDWSRLQTRKLLFCLLSLQVWMDSLRWPFTAMRSCLLTAVCTGCLQPSTGAPVPSPSATFPLTGRTALWSSGEHWQSWRKCLAVSRNLDFLVCKVVSYRNTHIKHGQKIKSSRKILASSKHFLQSPELSTGRWIILFSCFLSALSSQTYSASEIEMLLKVEDNHTLEWVDIDPEAFTGTENR